MPRRRLLLALTLAACTSQGDADADATAHPSSTVSGDMPAATTGELPTTTAEPTSLPPGDTTATDPTTTSDPSEPTTDAEATTDDPPDPTGEPADDLSPKTYAADDPRIQYTGRIDFSDPKTPTYSAPGVHLRVRFNGIAAAVEFEDQFVYDVNRNFYEVIVDDLPPVKLAPTKGTTRYTVASGLANTTHTVTFVKRTESALGWTKFKGVEIEGELIDPLPRPARRMIFIGDSITCGSGNEAANNSGECYQDAYGNGGGWGQPYHNNWMSYGAVTARTLGAEYHVTAVSGIGLVRNYSFLYDARPLPEVYDLTFLELQQGSPQWDPQAFVPDVVVIALGTNDFSPGDSPRPPMTVQEFTAGYIPFVQKLRGYWPDAHIFAVSSPMLGDGWPSPNDKYLTDQQTALANVEAHFQSGGDPNVHAYNTTKLYGDGCGTHPSVAQHQAMAAELGAFIQTTVGW